MPLSAQQLAAQKNLSYVLAEKLAQRILKGDYAPGTILPGEIELGEQYGVSRTAVREAVKTLTAKGMVLPRPRIGTRVMPLFILGMAMSTQFTAMNTITLADLTDDNASSGNSVLAVTQQLSISLGVAISAAVLRIYEGFAGTSTVEQFHYTFITMGAITIVSALMFMLLRAKDGNNLIKERHKSKPTHAPSKPE